jgi:hypothetical protein
MYGRGARSGAGVEIGTRRSGLRGLGPKLCRLHVSGRNRVVRISWSRSPHRLETWPPGHTQPSLVVGERVGGVNRTLMRVAWILLSRVWGDSAFHRDRVSGLAGSEPAPDPPKKQGRRRKGHPQTPQRRMRTTHGNMAPYRRTTPSANSTEPYGFVGFRQGCRSIGPPVDKAR